MQLLERLYGNAQHGPDGSNAKVFVLSAPMHETFDGFVLGEPQRVVEAGGFSVPRLGPLPEFPHIRSGEQRSIFLGFVLEDGIPFAHDFLRAQGNGHLNLIRCPLLPGAAIQPDFAVAVPRFVLDLVARLEDRGKASSMCAVRIGQVAGGIDLVWLNFSEAI